MAHEIKSASGQKTLINLGKSFYRHFAILLLPAALAGALVFTAWLFVKFFTRVMTNYVVFESLELPKAKAPVHSISKSTMRPAYRLSVG